MKINPSIHKKKLLYPMAAAVVLSGCQQQQHSQRLSGAPLPPPEVQLEPVVKPQEKKGSTSPQRLVGRKAVREGRGKNQHFPGKKRASR
ncbi:MAG: hypothetical protein J6R92_00210 [Akkermansia sp.]|nr:hypothetical protein [Akkermansia sp.]